MDHPLLTGKSTWFTSSGFIVYLLTTILFLLTTSEATAQCATGVTGVITVVKNGKVVEDANPDLCEGGTLVLTAWMKRADGERYKTSTKWNNGATGSELSVNAEGTYTATITDGSCTVSATVYVTLRSQAQKPTISVDGKPTSGIVEICDDRSVKLTTQPQSDVVYVWERNGVDIADAPNTNEYTTNVAGKYSVRVSNTCGSIRSDVVDLKLSNNPVQPEIDVTGDLKFCQGSSVTLSVREVVDDVTYTWYRDGKTFTSINTSSVSTDMSGKYTVVVSNSCGKSTSSNPVTVEVLPLITPQTQDVETCINTNATLTATGGKDGQYRWYTTDDPNAAPDPSRRGDTYVTQVLTQDATFWVAIYNGACDGPRIPIKVKVSTSKVTNKPTITANGPTKFCEGTNASVQLRVPAITGIRYQWTKDGENHGPDSNVLTATESGEYTVILLDACGNVEAENRIVVDVTPVPTAPKVTDGYACNPSTFQLKASGANEGEYRWYNSKTNPTPFFGETGSTYTTTYLSSNTTFYVSIFRDGCESERVPVQAIISGPPVAEAGPNKIMNPGEKVMLEGSGDGTYEWFPATGLSNPNMANPMASPTKTTVYTLRVSRGADCVGEDQVTVIVREPLDIPNAFSPNGDGRNDNWVIGNMDTYPDARLEVFNRWGSKVYDKVGYQNDWNGTFRGSPLPVGTYFYVITLTGGNQMTGSVSIVQ